MRQFINQQKKKNEKFSTINFVINAGVWLPWRHGNMTAVVWMYKISTCTNLFEVDRKNNNMSLWDQLLALTFTHSADSIQQRNVEGI